MNDRSNYHTLNVLYKDKEVIEIMNTTIKNWNFEKYSKLIIK